MSQDSTTPPTDPDEPGFGGPGVTETPGGQIDYFGFYGGGKKWYFPDGITYMEFSAMNEGQKKKFQKASSRDVTIKRGGDAKLAMDVAEERWDLIITVTSDWNLVQAGPDGNRPVPFSTVGLKRWLEVADPKLVADYEFAIRKANPWLQGDMTTADIDEEVERLQELRKDVEAEENRKASSSSS